jgi:hypothetical protein
VTFVTSSFYIYTVLKGGESILSQDLPFFKKKRRRRKTTTAAGMLQSLLRGYGSHHMIPVAMA